MSGEAVVSLIYVFSILHLLVSLDLFLKEKVVPELNARLS